MYSVKQIGARVTRSAKERTVETAPLMIGRVTVLPPKMAWSTAAAVMPTALVAMPLVTANWKFMRTLDGLLERVGIRTPNLALDFTALKPKEAAADAKSRPRLV